LGPLTAATSVVVAGAGEAHQRQHGDHRHDP
jgi:hypothetical protein